MSEEEIVGRMLGEDKLTFVFYRGKKLLLTWDAIRAFNLRTGQTVDAQTVDAIVDFMIEACQAEMDIRNRPN